MDQQIHTKAEPLQKTKKHTFTRAAEGKSGCLATGRLLVRSPGSASRGGVPEQDTT